MENLKNDLPLLSVIVAAYNVEQYIEDVIDSIVTQSYPNIEVLIINDGSTDLTKDKAENLATVKDNVRVINRTNAGLSASRNVGVEMSNGQYLAFVDGDDLVPEGAYQSMMETILTTDSDMISGFVERLNERTGKRFASPHFKKAIQGTFLQTNIRQHSELVYDSTAWNKIYKKSLFTNLQLKYPVGRLYEDIPVEMRAHLNAKTVDVINNLVYTWRIRSNGAPSITQDRLDPKGLTDRLEMLKLARHEILTANNAENVLQAFDYKMLDQDLFVHIEALENRTISFILPYYQTFVDFLGDVDLVALLPKLPVAKQLMYRLFLGGEFEAFSMFLNKDMKVKYRLVESKLEIANKYVPEYIKEAMVLNVSDKAKATVSMLKWHNESYKADIEGNIVISSVDAAELPLQSSGLTVINFSTGETMTLPVDIILPSKKSSSLKYRFSVDTENVLKILGDGVWKFKLSISFGNVHADVNIGNPIRNGRKRVRHLTMSNEFVQYYDREWNLIFDFKDVSVKQTKIAKIKVPVTFAGLSEDMLDYLKVTLVVADNDEYLGRVQLADGTDEFELVNDIDTVYFAKIPLQKFQNKNVINLSLQSDNPNLSFIVNDFYPIEASGYRVGKVEDAINVAKVVDKVEVYSIVPASNGFEAELSEIPDKLIAVTNTGFEVDLSFTVKSEKVISTAFTSKNDTSLLKADEKWRIFGVFGGLEVPLVFDQVKAQQVVQLKNYKVFAKSDGLGFLYLETANPWTGVIERHGKVRKYGTRLAYIFMRLLPLKKNLWVFDAYWASQFSSNEKAMYEYLQENHPNMKSVWFLKDTSIPISGNGKKVREKSFAYYWTLARAKFLVQNANFPQEYVKRRGQIEVETLHGTFMKTMGFDEPHFTTATRNVKTRFAERNLRWDYIVSPSKFMDFSPFVFRTNARVIKSGFPRNDVLVQGNNVQNIERLKLKLGIPAGNEVVLYAPTFRNQGGFDFQLDIEKYLAKLGDRQTLVVRLHYFVAKEIDFSQYGDRIINASEYPVIEDLYLVSDVLVTDYSSVMFDYAVLNRPMVFFAYDLEWYLSPLNRGTYLEYEKILPGPIVKTSDDLIDVLSDIEALKQRYSDNLAVFRDEFVTYGRQGDAAKTVVERILSDKNVTSTAAIKHHIVFGVLRDIYRINNPYRALMKVLKKYISVQKNLVIIDAHQAHGVNVTLLDLASDAVSHGKKVLWIVDESHKAFVRQQGYKTFRRNSLRLLYWRLKAETVLFNGIQTDEWVKNKDQVWTQVWSALPQRKIGLEQDMLRILAEEDISQKFMLKTMHMADYFVVPTVSDASRLEKAFEINSKFVLPLGWKNLPVKQNENLKSGRSNRKLLFDTSEDISFRVGDFRDGFVVDIQRLTQEFDVYITDSMYLTQFGVTVNDSVTVVDDVLKANELLSEVDVVVTGSGILAERAVALGIQTVVMDSQRVVNKSDRLIANRDMHFVDNQAALFETLESLDYNVVGQRTFTDGASLFQVLVDGSLPLARVSALSGTAKPKRGAILYTEPYGIGKNEIIANDLAVDELEIMGVVNVVDEVTKNVLAPSQYKVKLPSNIVGYMFISQVETV